MNLIKINAGTPQQFNVVIEVPTGSNNKYEYDEKEGYFKLDRTLHSPVYYPFDYGFIPQTRSNDNDALDVIVLTEQPTFPGCIIKCRPVGVLESEDEHGIDAKIIAVPIESIEPRRKEMQDITDIKEHRKKEIEEFIKIYKELEPNKWTKFKGYKNKEQAIKIIEECTKKYKEE